MWYAIWTRSHFEQIVHDELDAKGFETFLPKAPIWIKRVGGRHRVDAPLFPSYVFIRHFMDKSSHVEILKARGVVRVLGDRWDRLAPIPDGEIETIQRVVDAGEPMFRYPMLAAGDRVRITAGPLQGVEGLFVRSRPDRGLLVISVNLLQRSVAVEIDGTQVEVA